MSRKVVLFITSSLTGIGGAERHLFDVVRKLRTSTEYRPEICCLGTYGSPLIDKMEELGIEVQKICVNRMFRVYGGVAIRNLMPLVSFMKEKKVRIVQNYHFAADIYGTIAAKLAGVPVIVSSRRDMGFWFSKRHSVAYRFIDHFVDKIISVSDRLNITIQSREHVSPSKIATIHNGVDLERLDGIYEPNRIRQSLGIAPSCLVIIAVGNMRPIKGHKYLLEAMSCVLDKVTDARLLIVGKEAELLGTEESNLRKQAKELRIGSNVIFTGHRMDIPDLISAADIAVLPSLSEGFSNVLLEYMAMGKPVVATDVGGNPEALVDRQTGIIVPPADSEALANGIMTFIRNRELAEEMGRAGRKRLKEMFSLDGMVQKMEALYDSLLTDNSTAR